MALFGWENNIGLWAFLTLIPFILFYLIKPKAKNLEVPSLMFFMKSTTKQSRPTFFRKLNHNILFLLQLFALLALCAYFLEPYTSVGSGSFTEHAILIVDVSASTQADNNNVFRQIIAEAEDHLGNSNTIIPLTTTPYIGIKDVGTGQAEDYLESLQPTDGTTPLQEALQLAEKQLQGDKDKIIVISDFVSTTSLTPAAAQEQLAEKGITVMYVPIRQPVNLENIGIIDIALGSQQTMLTIKNFQEKEVTVPISIGSGTTTKTIPAQESITHTFPTPTKETTATLNIDDDFAPDNTAVIAIPKQQRIRVALISDTPSTYLRTALTASDLITLDVLPSTKVTADYDSYIIGNVRSLPATTITILEKAVKSGAGLIVHAQTNSLSIDYGNLLPVTLKNLQQEGTITIEQVTKFTQNIAFGTVDNYFGTTSLQDSITIASIEDSSIISMKPYGQGKIIYYGILEQANDFTLNPSYPLFWVNAIKYISSTADLEDVHVATGSVLPLTKPTQVTTPTTTTTTDILVFDHVGLYTVGDITYASNLLNERESTLTPTTLTNTPSKTNTTTESVAYPLGKQLLILAIILLCLELLILKVRGEL